MSFFRVILTIATFASSSGVHGFSICDEEKIVKFDINHFLIEEKMPAENHKEFRTQLSKVEGCNPALFNRVNGEINQFGFLGSVNVELAINYYNEAVRLGDLKANYYLGTIYLVDDQFKDLPRALYYTEIAAVGGVEEAIKNLVYFKKIGYYPLGKLVKILKKFSASKNEDISILYAQEMYYFLNESKDESGLLNLLAYLSGIENGKYSSSANLLKARIYLTDWFPMYNFEEGIKYLKIAESKGNVAAPKLIKMYLSKKDAEGTNQ